MNLFYTPDISDNVYTLDEEESKHAVRVLRLNENDKVLLTNGKGVLYTAKVIDAHPKRCSLEVISQIENHGKRNFYTHIAVAPTKNNDRLEWFLEKATEIGIDEISLVYCDFSERRVVKTERLEKIVISAMKQSMQTYLPKINEPCKFSEFINRNLPENRFIAHCYETDKQSFKNNIKPETETLILIGPEGDFSDSEIQTAIKNKFIPVTLGNTRLRTETAALAACHTVVVVNE